MKKLFIYLAVLFICNLVQGQSYIYQSFLSGVWPPAGWTSLPLGSQWSVSPTVYAGGTLPEAVFEGFDYVGTVRLISPLVDMTDADTAIISFRYFPQVDTTDTPILGVSTRSGNDSWNIAWETQLKNSNEPREFEILITGDDLGKPDFQLSFFLTGNMNRLSHFYLDNIKLYYPTGPDAKVDEILTPSYVELPEPVEVRIINLGNSIINQVGVTFITTTGILHDSLITGLDLGLFESFVFQFNRWWVSPFGDYNLKAWINSVNGEEDPYHPNDTLVKRIRYQHFQPVKMPCFEEFTASSDDNSVWFDHIFETWSVHHPYQVAVNYTMSFPFGGDPYFIPDNDIRRLYYGVENVPRTFCNGTLAAYIDTNEVQLAYDSAMMETSKFKILSYYSIIGDSVFITNNIFPFESMTGTSVHTIVTENTTYGNTGGPGEVAYHNVVMKMLPDGGSGAQVDFYNGIPSVQNFSADLSQTNIEEYDDLSIIIFIQADSSKEFLQAAYSRENAAFSGEDRLSMITLDGVPLQGFDPDTYFYDVALPAGTVEPPVVCGIPLQDSAWMLIQQAFEMPGQAIIDVYPESLGSIKRYIVYFNYITNVDDREIRSISVYPNPVHGKLFITGVKDASARLYGLDGKLIFNQDKFVEGAIDLSGVKSGVYILSLTDKEGMIVMKKIIVM